ncbi:MAG: thiosulfate oxidation carrier complex protein SoxZ [Thermaceae bacterium]
MAIRMLIRFAPAKPKPGEVFKLQVVAQHPMELGTRKDEAGKPIPANYINLLEVYFEGQKVAEIRPGGSTSANPLFALKFKADKPGTFTVKAKDLSGDTGEAQAKLELA